MAYLAAVVLAAVFVLAAAAKLARPGQTADGLTALGVPGSGLVGRLLPVAELAVAVALLSVPRAGGITALVLLAAFSAVIASRMRAGVTAPCACFGTTAAAEPISWVDLFRNGLLTVVGVTALFATRPAWPEPLEVLAAVVSVAAGVVVLRAARRRQPSRRAAR